MMKDYGPRDMHGARALPRERSRRTAPCHRIPARTPEAGLGRWPQCSDRFSMGLGRRRVDTIRRHARAATGAGRDPS
jgi:hypothetical protein